MYNDYVELRDLKETAEILAYIDDWPDLYNSKQLAKNEVPVYSATFVDDMCTCSRSLLFSLQVFNQAMYQRHESDLLVKEYLVP